MKVRKDPLSLFLRGAVWFSGLCTIAVAVTLVGYILIKGVPYLTPDLFAWEYNSDNVSLLPALINTVLMTLLSLLIAVPLGVGAAIYLAEYARRGNKLVRLVRLTAETLSGIPSIVYGLFGSLFFVVALGWDLSLLSGAFTLAIMILPLVMRTTEEALLSVPDSFREGSFALGTGRLRTVMRVVLPPATPGIMAGIVLGIGRIVGETAALIFTAGTVAKVANNVWDSTRTLSVHLYTISREGQYLNQTYATAVVLLALVIGINALTAWIERRIQKSQ